MPGFRPLAPLLALPIALFLSPVPPLGAQSPSTTPGAAAAVPAPHEVLGYPIGARFTPHHLVVEYLSRVAAASPRVRLDTLGYSFEGRPLVLATVTSPANQQRLSAIRDAARRLALPSEGEDVAALVASTPSIAWLGFTVHGNEASGVEASLALVYRLASATDAETQMVLDSTVVLIDPVENPDGHERFVQDNLRLRGELALPTTPGAMVHQGNWPGGRTSHYLFDLNRDWFILSHPESQARVATFTSWWPQLAVDLHEMGSNSSYFFSPPMPPFNPNVDANIIKWWDVYAASNAAAFAPHGWSFFRREGYDEFYPGYGVSWPTLTGAIGMTYEQASSAGGAIRRSDGTVLTLAEAARHHYEAAWATLVTTARRRAERVGDFASFRRRAIDVARRAPLRAVAFGPDAQGRADSLAQLLLRNGIDVGRLTAPAEMPATPYGSDRTARTRLAAGTYVVDLAQPQGRLATALLEPDARLDSAFIAEELESRRTGEGDRFYDVTAWSLPYTFRVPAWALSAAPGAVQAVTPVSAAEREQRLRALNLNAMGEPVPAGRPAAASAYGWAFEPGSEASMRLLAQLLADSVRVWYAPHGFRSGAANFPHGAYVVRRAANPAMRRSPVPDVSTQPSPATPFAGSDSTWAEVPMDRYMAWQTASAGATVVPIASALVDDGTDLGSNSVAPLTPVRVALLGGDAVSSNSFGFAWYAFDQRLHFPTTALNADAVAGGILRDFDVLVVPSASAGGLDAALGDGGRRRLGEWVRDGGTLVTLDGATSWLARESLGLSRFRMKSERPDSGHAPLPANVPGAIVRVVADTLSPLMAGVRDTEFPVMAQGNRIYQTPPDLRPGEVVLRHAPASRLRIAGYLWPEVPARLAGTPYLWTERVGRGRVIAFAGDPNFRDLWRGLLPLFANAVLGG